MKFDHLKSIVASQKAACDMRMSTDGGLHLGAAERLSDAGLVAGKTVGIDATTLEANRGRSVPRRPRTTEQRIMPEGASPTHPHSVRT